MSGRCSTRLRPPEAGSSSARSTWTAAIQAAAPSSRSWRSKARAESASIAWRVEQWQEGCRLKGKWTGKRPYGFRVIDGRLVRHPDEAPVVRRIVSDFLNGASLVQIARDLNDADIPSSGAAKAADMRAQGRESRTRLGVTWAKETVRVVLINPALIGWRAHNGQVVLDPDGEPVSFGESIITPGERARVLAALQRRTTTVRNSSNPGRVGSRTGGGRPGKYLLSGLARCESCTLGLVGFLLPGGSTRPTAVSVSMLACAARHTSTSRLPKPKRRFSVSS